MATVKIRNRMANQFGHTVPYGNTTTYAYDFKTGSTGAVLKSDAAGALAVGDVLDLGSLPEGMRLDDAAVLVSVALTDSATASLGFAYEDGEDSAEVPEDAEYFGDGIALDSVGRVRATGSKLVTLPKPARLILTLAGADNAKASEVAVMVQGELLGKL